MIEMITLLLLIPLIGSLFILPMSEIGIKNQIKMKKIALITSLINFFIFIIILKLNLN